jgi:hypothetical protein
LNEFAN